MQPELVKSEIKLTIGMLVSNHIQYIRKAMEALKPLLMAVPSELVVLDTKGEETDGSIDIVREYTDKIYPFTWCNDFSAARNELLDHANGEWFLYVDDDEWFDDVQEFIDFFKSGECEEYYTGFYYTRDYAADGSYSTGIAGRMIRRMTNTCFVGMVHETFNEVYAPNKMFNCFTHHYGYAYGTEEDAKKKQERNVSILLQELKEKGYDPKVCAQLTQEFMQRAETSLQGVQFAKDALEKMEQKGVLADSYCQWMMTAIVRHFTRTEEHEMVFQAVNYIETKYKLTELACLVLAATVAGTAFLAGKDEEAVSRVNEYLELYLWRKENEEEALLQTQLDFPRFFEASYYYKMLHVGAAASNRLEKYEQANQYWKMMPFKEEGFDSSRYAADLNTTIKGLKKTKEKKERADKKNVLFELCDMLHQVGDMTGQYLAQGAWDSFAAFLAQMQETAIALGGEIDKFLGEENREVPLLESYCEAVWNCSNAGTVADAEALLAEAQRLLSRTKEYLEADTREKKTVVFLPYKASMWDSLESVWRAAAEDEECNAYVVPIPYYDLNPDGTRGEFHYEIDQFPKDVPVVRFEDFDLCVERPDMVFIHNPYDDCNRITSIHPNYYSANLKRFTKKLVYIPYFVMDDKVNIDNPRTREKMESLILLPGVINADQVIVQSEPVKRVYVQLLTEAFGKEREAEWEEKILPLGSPKFDKVVGTTREEIEVPEEWKLYLYHEDGSKKPVVLYNNSVSALLRHQMAMIEKMRRVFADFKANKDNITLLWRPHPLIRVTIEATNPELWSEYKKLMDSYLEEAWGIYDDTSDLNRAIALADAYYGDGSSLVQLCEEKGMPVMVQDVEA